MNDEKWQEIVELAKNHFRDASLHTEDLTVETQDGPQKRGTRDVLEFEHPNGDRFKLVRENHPVVLEKKEHFSRRMGDTARTEYKFSETEFSRKLRVYKENSMGDWDEITLDKLGL
jgi:hypothetical protein